VVAGAVAGTIAAIVQLPLHSPSDTVFNSASVSAGALAAGGYMGLVWREAVRRRVGRRWQVAAFAAAAGFLAGVVIAVVSETQLERSLSYVLPLAAIVFATTGALTPALAGVRVLGRRWLVFAIVTAAVTVGAGLAGMGDAPSGRLELPPRGG
jgi:hypothetical protein